jgi:hypothetical protein
VDERLVNASVEVVSKDRNENVIVCQINASSVWPEESNE